MRRNTFFLLAILLAIGSSYYWLKTVWVWSWTDLLRHPDQLPIEQAAVQMSVLPEIAVAFLAGGLLSLATTALQQIVRNPLASDSTLAVNSGAQLALMMVTLFLPAAGLFGSFWIALLGALASTTLVLTIAANHKLHPPTVILAGLIINLLCGAIAAVLVLFYHDLLLGIMVWGSGSLLQDGWTTALALTWTTLAAIVILGLLHRPLTLLDLDDTQAQRLGAPVKMLRYAILLLAATTTAMVVSRVGIISFIGLAGASTVNLLSIRQLHKRFIASFIFGGLLLLITANLLNLISHHYHIILPTGALTGILGVPLLLCLVMRERKTQVEEAPHDATPLHRLQNWRIPLFAVVSLLVLLFLLQGFTANLHGWGWLWDTSLILDHRLPRSLSAIATSGMLACGGALLQILTRNPMASPEVLGISSGAALAVLLAFFFIPTLNSGGLLLAGCCGSGCILAIILLLSRRLQPSSLLLVGVAIAALMHGVMTWIQQSGNPQLSAVLSWLSGNTYYAQPQTAWLLICAACLFIALSLLLCKALKLLSLGTHVAGSLGLSVPIYQSLILLLVALMSAVSTLAVGSLSFIGLMTPQFARRLGAVTPEKQLPLAALIGAILMLLADWLGRYLIFPYEIGAGTLAALIGSIYFLVTVLKKNDR
ncbi:MAG: Fe(3+)-hydroxamate ABC transporter permease FhuB [Cardiobacteriaceae bacterium]|nr:Fe(3+)-hydroxamate ABC transporter permease FhuB [Cardiobacteriaceae bacterium]